MFYSDFSAEILNLTYDSENSKVLEEISFILQLTNLTLCQQLFNLFLFHQRIFKSLLILWALNMSSEHGYDWLKLMNFQEQHIILIQEYVLLM